MDKLNFCSLTIYKQNSRQSEDILETGNITSKTTAKNIYKPLKNKSSHYKSNATVKAYKRAVFWKSLIRVYKHIC